MQQQASRSWSSNRHPDRPRLLVEDPHGSLRDAEFRNLELAGFEVALCTGPDTENSCPLVTTGECGLVEGADVVLFGLGLDGEPKRDVLRALRRRYPATPVVVEIPRQHPEWEHEVPRDCRALAFPASVEGQIWTLHQALEGGGGRKRLARRRRHRGGPHLDGGDE